jgi:hypothetical protein
MLGKPLTGTLGLGTVFLLMSRRVNIPSSQTFRSWLLYSTSLSERSIKRTPFGAGRDLGPPERREGGSRHSATADHIHFAAAVEF